MKSTTALVIVALTTWLTACGKKSNPSTTGSASYPIPQASATCAGSNCMTNSAFATDYSSQTNLAKFLYYLLSGPPSAGYPSGYSGLGPSSGLSGLINAETGGAIASALLQAGYSACSAIPASGSYTTTVSGLTYGLYFQTPSVTVPSHFSSYASQTHTKRVEIDRAASHYMTAEAICIDTSNVSTGYVNAALTGSRYVETWFQYNTGSTITAIDLYMTYGTEKFAARFSSADGDTFSLWAVRIANDSGTLEGRAVGIRGTRSTTSATIYVVEDLDGNPNDTTLIHLATNIYCVNSSTGAGTTGTPCTGLSLSSAGNTAYGSPRVFSISDVYQNLTINPLSHSH